MALAVPLAVAIEPVRETLGYGQVNLLLFALIMADLVALRWRVPAGHRTAARPTARCCGFCYSGAWAGVGIGLATAVKLTPALFIVYLLITRQWRAAMTAIGTAARRHPGGTFAVAGRESPTYFTQRAVADRAGRRRGHDAEPVAGRAARPALRLDRDARPALARRSRC